MNQLINVVYLLNSPMNTINVLAQFVLNGLYLSTSKYVVGRKDMFCLICLFIKNRDVVMVIMKRLKVTILVTLSILLLLLMLYLVPSLNIPKTVYRHNKIIKKNSNKSVLKGNIYKADSERSHADLCPSSGVKLSLVILVASEPRNIKARDVVRKTWAHFAFRSDVAFAFIIGTPPGNLTDAVEEEDMLYGDIIIGKFRDITLMTLSMLEWVDTNCNRAPLMFKTNDDIFINVQRLIDFSKEVLQKNAKKTIWGRVMKLYYPAKKTQSKQLMSSLQNPKVRLNFTSGRAYLLTTDVIKDILSAAGDETYLGNEDIFVTGVIASKLEIERKDVPLFNIEKIFSRSHPCILQGMISFPKMSYNDFFILWRQMFNDTVNCDSFGIVWVPQLVDLSKET